MKNLSNLPPGVSEFDDHINPPDDNIDGIFCRQCGFDITEGYSWRGYCNICAEKRQGGIAPATSEMLIRLLRDKNKNAQ